MIKRSGLTHFQKENEEMIIWKVFVIAMSRLFYADKKSPFFVLLFIRS